MLDSPMPPGEPPQTVPWESRESNSLKTTGQTMGIENSSAFQLLCPSQRRVGYHFLTPGEVLGMGLAGPEFQCASTHQWP